MNKSTKANGLRGAFTMIELIFVIVILGILAAVAVPRLAGVQDDALASTENAGIGAVRSGVQALNGRLMTNSGNVQITVYERGGAAHSVLIDRNTTAVSNGRIAWLSVNDAWGAPVQASNQRDQTLAMVLDASTDRAAWITAQDTNTSLTRITGPATRTITDTNQELNTNKHWLYNPSSTTISLQ